MNPFHHAEHAYELIDAVMEQPAISDVAFTISLVGGVTLQRLFGEVGADTLLCVDLTGNNIKTNDDRCITRFLSTNPLLEELYLGQNQFNDDDGIHIAQALQSNINLEILDLESNALTEKGKHTMYSITLRSQPIGYFNIDRIQDSSQRFQYEHSQWSKSQLRDSWNI